MPLLGSRTVFTPTLLACYGITAAVHVASIVLNTLLPFHVVDLGGTKTQVGLLFSVMTIVARLPANVACPAAAGPPRLRLISRSALAVSFALVLSTIGHSSVFAFLPLYALGQGQTAALAWFFVIYPAWLITWRALLRGVSDRLGHVRVSVFAMSVLAVAYLLLALPPTPLSLALAALVLASGNALLYPP